MNRSGLAWAGLRHGWRRQIGLLLASLISTAVLVGALLVGDSVRASLHRLAKERIGRVEVLLDAGDRWFRAALAPEFTATSAAVQTAAALRLPGLAGSFDGTRRANGVQVLGVDAAFFRLSPDGLDRPLPPEGQVLVNERLARQLNLQPGDGFMLRLEAPGVLPKEAALSGGGDATLALRVEVAGVLDAEAFGHFSLEAHQIPQFNCLLSREWLSRELGRPGRANLLLVHGATVARADEWLRHNATLDDLELSVEAGGAPREVEVLTSRRIFLDPAVEAAARTLEQPALGALTYFVNEIRHGERSTPYSTVTALGPLTPAPLEGTALDLGSLSPAGLAPDHVVINTWLADDLLASPGDLLEFRYFVLGADLRLREESRGFTVHSIVPLQGAAADPSWMPDFPGLKDSENCRDWEPGIPLDLARIRDRDEEYWDRHRGTPKAFLSLAAGQELWGSRFGALTAIRTLPAPGGPLADALRDRLDPARLGLFFQDLRGPALEASHSATDFGGLFLGLSLFLIISSVLLSTLLFRFGVEQRSAEIGALLAQGFTPDLVRGLLLREAAAAALLGGLPGAALGIVYTRLILHGLGTLWQEAVASAPLFLDVEPATLLIGIAAAFAVSMASLFLAIRRQVRIPAATLLSAQSGIVARPARGGRGAALTIGLLVLALAGALALFLFARTRSGPAAAGADFGAGALVLLALLCICRFLLHSLDRRGTDPALSLTTLGLKNAARRPGRSLTTIFLLAAGVFLVLAIGVNRLTAPGDPARPSSGTGGFRLIAESSVGLLHNLNDPRGREAYGLTGEELDQVEVLPLRLGPGDEANCLNLSLSQNPRLAGVDPEALARRGAFSFAETVEPASGSAWRLLQETAPDGVVPTIGDAASVTWSLHKKVGDTLDYRDDRGRPFQVRIVATLENSILQGLLLIDEDRFRERYPSAGGYRLLLIDAPAERADAVSGRLTGALSDVGLELTPTASRLAAFNAVQNTYLSIFQILGGLGVLLGTAGLALVVLRNVLERRFELAVYHALGYSRGALRWLLLCEHGALLLAGLLAGSLAAAVAVLPSLRESLSPRPLLFSLLIALGGALWVLLAALLALRGSPIESLRSE